LLFAASMCLQSLARDGTFSTFVSVFIFFVVWLSPAI
jgi:hypothetical protein